MYSLNNLATEHLNISTRCRSNDLNFLLINKAESDLLLSITNDLNRVAQKSFRRYLNFLSPSYLWDSLWNLSYIFFLGIGQGRLTQNLKDAPIDDSLFISDQASVNMV